MAGKALNSYADRDTGIDMPPLDETPPITAAPDPWQEQESGVAPVPETAPSFEEEPQENEPEELEEAEEVEEDDQPEAQAAPRQKESNANKRIRQLKESQKKAERERDEMMQMMQMQMMQMQQQQAKQPEPEPEYEEPDLDLDDDGLAENRHIKAMHRDMKELRKQLKHQQEEAQRIQFQTQNAMVETRIKTTFPDFDEVVSSKNIEKLKELHPDVAQTLYSTADLYSKASSAYKFIKQLGIHRPKEVENDRLRAIKNASKPRPIASIGGASHGKTSDSPLTRVNGFANIDSSEEAKKAAYREMVEAIKNH